MTALHPVKPREEPPRAAARRGAQACRALERALRHGRVSEARGLLRRAARAIRRRPRLAERLAQHALAAGDPGLALKLTDLCRRPTASLRALQRICLAELDRPADDGARGDGLRLAVRQLNAGATCAAERTLRRAYCDEATPEASMLVLALAAGEGDRTAVERWSKRVLETTAWTDLDETARLMLDSLDRWPRAAAPRPAAIVEGLAHDLVNEERAIAPLAASLGLCPDEESVELLAAAVHEALPQLSSPGAAAETIATMLLEHGRAAEARTWAEQALSSNPFSAIAARLMHDCNRSLYTLPRDRGDGGREAA